jgi:hypothetical protein
MSFLDDSLELRPTGTNISQPPSQECSADPPQSPSPPLTSAVLPLSPPSPQTQPQQSLSQPSTSKSLPSSSPRTTKRKIDSDADNTEKVLDYLRNKKKKEWDSVDHLFMSYAKSFKQLSVRKQGKIKVELAKLFADAEIAEVEELQNNAMNRLTSSSPVLILSPSYSVISDDSTIFLESQQEPTQADEDTWAVDLSYAENANQNEYINETDN